MTRNEVKKEQKVVNNFFIMKIFQSDVIIYKL